MEQVQPVIYWQSRWESKILSLNCVTISNRKAYFYYGYKWTRKWLQLEFKQLQAWCSTTNLNYDDVTNKSL